MSGRALLTGYAADLALGDPHRLHPVAGFGQAAASAERLAYGPSRQRGALLTAALVGGAALAAELLARSRPPGRELALVAITWAALGGRSLRTEAGRVAELVRQGDIEEARRALRSLCGRNAEQLDGTAILRGVIESVAENTSDAVVGALLWGAIAGPAGVAGYRAANTLDAMFGHRNDHYADFGFAAARLDDALNWPAARLTAALACAAAPLVGGNPLEAMQAVRRDASAHPSPNAGVVEAAFAGALGLELGGPLLYGTRLEDRPRLGDGRAPVADDVRRANRLSLVVGTLAAILCARVRDLR
jgi:adenosylcobinamide-phosphate synthase